MAPSTRAPRKYKVWFCFCFSSWYTYGVSLLPEKEAPSQYHMTTLLKVAKSGFTAGDESIGPEKEKVFVKYLLLPRLVLARCAQEASS